MLTFFKDHTYRKTFYKGLLACVVGSLIVISRALGRNGHPDETTIYLFFGVVVFAMLAMSWLLNNNYKKSLQRKRKL